MAGEPSARDVLDFLAARGFGRAAAALREDLRARGDPDAGFGDLGGFRPPLAPVRIPHGPRDGDDGADAGAGAGASSSSSDAFLSMGSSPSDLLNPYGVWSPAQVRSEDSSMRHSEFGTAREYNDANIFSDSHWYGDQFGDYLDDSYFITTNTNGCPSEDKFVMTIDAEEQFGKQDKNNFGMRASMGYEGWNERITCSFPLCDCCSGVKRHLNGESEELIKNSSLAIYGRYRIMPDETERLDECGDCVFDLKRVDEPLEAVVWDGDPLCAQDQSRERNHMESQLVEKELQVLNSSAANRDTYTSSDPTSEQKSSRISNYCFKASLQLNTSNEELQKEADTVQPYAEKTAEPDSSDACESRDCGSFVRDFQDPQSIDAGIEDQGIGDDLQFYNSQEDEYEVFNLRIIHHKNRTGFEENKDFPIVLNSVIAGRYYITEYLGSAAFSKVVQAHDLQTGVDVCLKIIKNDKDFFDQSLDEIKLLKFVNKHDPDDKHHILRLYDYFYHQEHLFIVCELLKANLYEFQKYNQDSGGDVYFTLPRIQSIARQCLEALEYLHRLRIIHCDLKPENILMKSYSRCEIKVIDLGSSCFQTDNLCLYVQSRSYRAPEVILGLSYDQRIDIWSLGCILAELYSGDVLFPNESVEMMFARMIGILGPIDIEMLMMGRETYKYFTEDYDLYHRSEETDQIEYLIPEKSSLDHQLQVSDTIFMDFLQYLLQINPQRRPTATQALQHQWLSFPYS